MAWPPTTHQDVQDAITVTRGMRAATAGKPDGALTTFDTGEAVANFGNSPLTISSGYWTHTPLNGANSAGYGEVTMGTTVGRVGATFRFPNITQTNNTVTFVCPSAPWSGAGFLSNSACHFTVTPTSWNYSLWQNGFGQVPLISGTHTLAADTDYDADVYFNGTTATVILPDRSVRQVTDARIVSWMGSTAVFEVYELSGVGANPAKISAARAESSAGRWTPGDGANFVGKALAGAVRTTPPAAVSVASTFDTVLTGTSQEIGGGAVRTTVTVPPSGKILTIFACPLELSAADNVIGQPRIIYGDGSTADGDAVSIQQSATYSQVQAQALMTGVAGSVVTLLWRAFKVGGATATFHAGGANGTANIVAIPVL